MGIGCIYKIFVETEDEPDLIPNRQENSCCKASNLELRFAMRDGNIFYAYMICKECGNRFTYSMEKS